MAITNFISCGCADGIRVFRKTGFTFDLANPEDMANVYYLKDNAIKIDPEDVIVSKHAYKIIFRMQTILKLLVKENRMIILIIL